MPRVSTGRTAVTLRELRHGDAVAVNTIVAPEIDRSRYSAGLGAAVDAVLSGATAESRALVAIQRGQVVGVVLFGAIAGSLGAGRVQLIVVAPDSRRAGIASALVERAIDALAAERMRAVFIELPDDPESNAVMRLLVRCEFRIDARVADYFSDGVDLAILRRDVTAPEARR